MANETKKAKMQIRKEIFIHAAAFMGTAAIVGIVNNQMLTDASKKFFNWSLGTFGIVYQVLTMACILIALLVFCSKFGNVRIGGKNAKAKYPFWTWFAMTLTGGVATGIVTWGVNEPLIYYGNVWGELDGYGIQPNTVEAAKFALGRCFYNWTFIPYAIYALAGLVVAYMYFNKKEKLNVSSTLKPLFGEKVTKGVFSTIVDLFSMLALTLGLTSGLTMCITLVSTGLKVSFGMKESIITFLIIGIIIIFFFTFSSYVGLDKGLKKVADLNAFFYYGLLILLVILGISTGATLFMGKSLVSGMGEWIKNFFEWGLDSGAKGGPALVQSWTLFDWAIWVAYAPVTGIFLGMIAYGRTVREFLIVNWILPSVFGLIWFSVWGGSALNMQMAGNVDLVASINEGGAIVALYEFMKNLPLGAILVVFNIIVIIISFVTAADAASTNAASMCVKDVPIGTEPPAMLKVTWGIIIGAIAIIMAAFGGGSQGVEGVKQLAAAGGFLVLFIFILQLVSMVKMFFIDKHVEPDDAPISTE